ncbi:MAG: hypothetical protein ACTSP0_02085 [Alphaproteobacteria bacterium]
MRMAWPKCLAFSLAKILTLVMFFVLTGCMKPPKMPKRVSVADVVNNARCELYQAVKDLTSVKDPTNEQRKLYGWLANWAAGYDLTLTVDRDYGASTNTSYVWPVSHGTFTIGFTAKLDKSAMTTMALGFKILKLDKYEKYDCSVATVSANSTTRRRLLNGEIGIRAWLNRVVPDIHASGLPTKTKGESPRITNDRSWSGTVEDLTYTLEFGIKSDGSISPSWALNYGNGQRFIPSFKLTKSRGVTHKLVIAMTPPAAPGFKDLTQVLEIDKEGNKYFRSRRVCVTNNNDPEACADQEGSRTAAQFFKQEGIEDNIKKAVDEAAARARDRATSRRLDALIQRQIIRDAFRN